MELTTGEPITREEFEALGGTGRHPGPDGLAVRALLPLTGVKFPCRWKHSGGATCGGRTMATYSARAAGFKINTHCRDGYLYVFRYE